MFAPGKSMWRICMHLPYVLIIYSLPVVFVCNSLFLSFCCIFICTNPKQTLLMSARSSFHCGMSTFLVTPSMFCVFICTNSRHTLKTCLCCAFYRRKPCHDYTLDLLCFHVGKYYDSRDCISSVGEIRCRM